MNKQEYIHKIKAINIQLFGDMLAKELFKMMQIEAESNEEYMEKFKLWLTGKECTIFLRDELVEQFEHKKIFTQSSHPLPFFNAWEFSGKFPEILNDPRKGPEARKLFKDAQSMLTQIIDEKWLRADAVFGCFPAYSEGNSIVILDPDNHGREIARTHWLRQQRPLPDGKPQLCLSDFIAPRNAGTLDFIGGFAVTTGHGIEQHVKRYEAEHDDYRAILLKVLADRFAESFAEHLHQRVRTEYWGYDSGEKLGNEDLIRERYRGIRPAPGYPSCPDHREKRTLWDLLDVETETKISLTDSLAMWPTSSVSGFYFAHPDARYFMLGNIGEDQVATYSQLRQEGEEENFRWLSPVLG